MKVDNEKREPYFKSDLLRKAMKAVPEGDVKTYPQAYLRITFED